MKNKIQLPNDIDMRLLEVLLLYSDRYEINVQFWPNQIAVYIEKDGVELTSYGGDFEFAVTESINHLKRINNEYRN